MKDQNENLTVDTTPDESEALTADNLTESAAFSVDAQDVGTDVKNITEDEGTEQTDIAEAVEVPPMTREQKKKLAAKYLIFAAIAFAGIYVVQIFHLFDPLFAHVYYGNLTQIFYYIFNAVFWIPFIIILNWQLYKRTGFKAMKRGREELSLKRSLVIYACTIVPIFIVSAILGFQLKIVYELGKRVTGIQLMSNAVMYVHGAVKLLIAVFILELVQEAIDLLYEGKFAGKIPWGGIALALIFGFGEVIAAYATGAASVFIWLYIVFDLLYGVLYLLCKRNFVITYFISLIIFIL